MKLTTLFMLTACITVSAGTFGQTVDFSIRKSSLEHFFKLVERQTGYSFLYSKEDIQTLEVSDLNVFKTDLNTALRKAFSSQPLTYTVLDKVVIVKRKANFAPSATMEVLAPAAIDISGTVTDMDGTPLPGASIQVKGTRRTAVSDVDGRFVISAAAGDVLVIRYVGFSEKEMKVGPETVLTIKLDQLPSRLQGVSIVSTGYTTLSKERAAGSFSSISAKDMANKMDVGLLNRLEGMAAGFTNYRGDAPQIRGVSSINAEIKPLFVVDGIPYEGDINAINPSDVASITMLKDASAASIYGARAANGVIVIVTKTGKPGPMRVNLSSSFRVTPLPDRGYMNRMSSSELVDFQREMFGYWSNDYSNIDERKFMNDVYRLLYEHKAGNISDAELDKALEPYRKNDRYQQVKDEFLRKAALVQQHNLSLSGGTDKHQYNLSVNYMRDNPYEKEQSNERFGYNLRNVFNLNNWARLDVGVLGSHTRAEYDNGFNGYSNLNGGRASYFMLRNPDGSPAKWYGGKSQFEIDRLKGLGLMDETMYPMDEVHQQHFKNNTNYLNMNVGLNLRLLKGLSLDVRYQNERTEGFRSQLYRANANYVRTMINDATVIKDGQTKLNVPTGGQYDETRTANNSYTLRAQLNFNRMFGSDHQVQFLAGAERRNVRETGTHIYRYGFDEFSLTSKSIDELTMLGTTIYGTEALFGQYRLSRREKAPYEIENRFVSFYGNGSYTFNRRWTATGSLRIDQSNLFGTNPKFQYRPLWSAGAMYVISENDLPWLDRLSARATYGVNGNVAKKTGPYLIAVNNGTNYYTNEPQAYIDYPPNPDLRWEKTNVINLGLDFNMFKGRLTGTLDFYNKQTGDLMGALQADPTIGWEEITVNYGAMVNRGVDVSLTSVNMQQNNFRWSSTFNFNYNKNELTDLYVSANSTIDYVYNLQNRQGKAMRSLYSIRYAGLDKTGRPQAYTKDGKIVSSAGELTPEDLVYSGTTVPPYSASLINNLKYKNFELFFMFIYYGGHIQRDVIAPYLTRLPELNYTTNMDRLALNYWRQPGDENNPDMAPAYYASAPTNSTLIWNAADKHISKASFIKLRDITLGYNLPSALLKKYKVQGLRLMMQVQNAWRWSANPQDLDAEVWNGTTLQNYPTRGTLVPTSYTFGLNLTF
ncbi:SusC/RagA family TonB-linked outer membrane protein [Chitinophaga rhizosphaerae]|uniref:SusC/RagA family TonB-linked outer membrane protein n=1 Tax=Chitinophaga rhizosphaerae TaxID=1864947 RepID=UPI0013E0C76F|nr:SusC/RagA family TonB-linked outer membrane protein [Chitinophaga rhizosphaerae]